MKDSYDFLNYADSLLQTGVSSSIHPFHQLYIASTNEDYPELRTVVLRKWSLTRRTIAFHSDSRSSKISQLQDNPHCSILFYSKEDRLQLRFKCFAHIHQNDRLADYFYSKTTDFQQECYRSSISPGTKLLDKQFPRSIDPRQNFSVVICNFNDLDLLFLNKDSHKRIVYHWDSEGTQSNHFVQP